MNQYFTPKEIIRILKEGNSREVNEVTTFLYKKYRQKVAYHVYKNNGKPEQADDILQEVMLKFLDLVQEDKFILQSKDDTIQAEREMEGYFMKIVYFKWLKFLEAEGRRKGRDGSGLNDEIQFNVENPLEILLSKESQKEANKIFSKLDEMCRNILLAFYVEEMSLEEIALKYNFTSVGAVKVKKFRCLEKLRGFLP
ncbi:sigma-70 family RNA polymerase sigma factor [Arcicella sp. LKC2W]|uniref:RNA polymerase sigma factor n=1 Tax=Arcicella sp. LKC2W TaxID=2984198 RepID=UPI002B1FAF85|nr:sigma-70 family RNA polymerase sigma factor [Arcicella sp. LKC2W]MEA5461065.1 sigma-70 family RNA polymerase sigma factor [Arcicella sp. LKC2W]